MNNELLFDGKTYVSVSQASKRLGYTADYIGQLCRSGKIDAKMIGRTWYVEWTSVRGHKKNKQNRVRRTAEEIRRQKMGSTSTTYILEEELKEVPPSKTEDSNKISSEKFYELPKSNDEDCPPEEYLKKIDGNKTENISTPDIHELENNSLILSALPISTNEDCPPQEYLEKIDAQNNFGYKASELISPIQSPLSSKEIISSNLTSNNKYFPHDHQSTTNVQNQSLNNPEEWLPKLIKKNTPVVSPYVFSPRAKEDLLETVNDHSRYANKIAIALSFLMALTTVSSWIGYENPKLASDKILPQIHNLHNEIGVFFNPNGHQLASVTTSDSDTTTNLSSVIGSMENGISYFFDGIKTKINRYALSYMKSLGFVPPGSSFPTNANNNPGRVGLVVVPNDPNHDATVATIKNSFSDQVDVRVDQDPTSGVIVPQFKTTKDTAYTYVMVPINSP